MDVNPEKGKIFLDASDVRTLGLKPEEPMTWDYRDAAHLANLVMTRTTMMSDYNPNEASYGPQQMQNRINRARALEKLDNMAKQLAPHIDGEETANEIEQFLKGL